LRLQVIDSRNDALHLPDDSRVAITEKLLKNVHNHDDEFSPGTSESEKLERPLRKQVLRPVKA
jgi:hypothetical protein